MIYLPEADFLSLRLKAESEDRSMAELIRRFIKKELSNSKSSSGALFLKKLAKYKIKGGKKLSRNIDTIYK